MKIQLRKDLPFPFFRQRAFAYIPALKYRVLRKLFDKILLIVAQVVGYTLSKFLGIKFVSESQFNSRGKTILGLIVMAELALLGFALTPKPYNVFFLFIQRNPFRYGVGSRFWLLRRTQFYQYFRGRIKCQFY